MDALEVAGFEPIQRLRCPGCNQGPYEKPSGLMEHIECDGCPRITLSMLEVRRADIEKRHRNFVGSGNLRYDFYGVIAVKRPEPPVVEDTPASLTSENPKKRKPVSFSPSEIPHLAALGGSSAPKIPYTVARRGDRNVRSESVLSSTAGSELSTDLLDDVPPKKTRRIEQPFPSVEQSISRPPTMAPEDVHDPGSKLFNVNQYRKYGKYFCPRHGCIRGFKKPGQLIGHLKGPDHRDKRYDCPRCSKQFNSLKAMAAHAESLESSCGIIHTDGYNAYIGQLTGGLVDVVFHEDMPSYKTNENALEEFAPASKIVREEDAHDLIVW